ncbi:MAG: O-antigen ligase family protein, partial [Thermodesulfobacteriota bacterium]|nr:O-antigen ligase family protein [Thermodesulfobacteriota bacterium]
MDTAPTYFQEQIHDNEKRLTLPIFLFLVYVVCTFFPHVYTFFPLLGTMKVVRVAGILLVVTYVFTRERYHNITAYKHPIFIAWVVFMIILPFGLIYSWDRGATLNKTQEAYKYFLVFLIMIRIIDSSKRLDLIMAVFAACAVGMALGSLFSGIVSAEGRTMSIDAGIFADPNDLCFLLNCALPFLLHLFLKSETKIIPIAGTAVVLTAVVLTFSRGGFLGLCMVGFGYTLFIARKSKKYLAPIFAAAVLIWFFSPTAYKERMSTITDFQVDNETGLTGTRIDTWLPAIKWGLEHPITGKGAGSTVYFNGMTRGDWHVTHNSLVQVFV